MEHGAVLKKCITFKGKVCDSVSGYVVFMLNFNFLPRYTITCGTGSDWIRKIERWRGSAK
jgi:hypothetical protein